MLNAWAKPPSGRYTHKPRRHEQMKYPYYRFSIHRDHIGTFRERFQHFVKLGIPCCITKENASYSLWRYGRETVEEHQVPNSEPIRGKIIDRSDNLPEEAPYLKIW